MAYQAHNIPWGSLATNFSYSKNPRLRPEADIYALDKPGQAQSLIHFAKLFAKSVRDYAAIEWRKYAPAAEYRRRARTWTRSDRHPDADVDVGDDVSPRQKQRNVCEARKVFSDQDRDLWRARKVAYRQDNLVDVTQYIDNWLAGDADWANVQVDVDDDDWLSEWAARNRVRDRWVGNWTDNFKALMMEAALTMTPLHQRQAKRDRSDSKQAEYMDTLFLLAHHPGIPLLDWTSEADGCCNVNSGLSCIVEAALTGYIYLNMLYAMRETGSKVCALADEVSNLHPYKTPVRCFNLPSRTTSSPRPLYMNTPSWYRFLGEARFWHTHHPEMMMFDPFLFPQAGENFTLVHANWPPQQTARGASDANEMFTFEEADVMTPASDVNGQEDPLQIPGSSAALRGFLRGLWKLMVNYEMLWTDQGRPPNWEVKVVGVLEECFWGISHERYSLIYDDASQEADDYYRDGNLFDGSKWEAQAIGVKREEKSQRAKNLEIKREARRRDRAEEKACSGRK